MQTITTKYLAPTNRRGSRIKVTGLSSSKTYSYDQGTDEPHKAAFELWLAEENARMANQYPDNQEAIDGNWFKLVAWDGLPDRRGCAFIIK